MAFWIETPYDRGSTWTVTNGKVRATISVDVGQVLKSECSVPVGVSGVIFGDSRISVSKIESLLADGSIKLGKKARKIMGLD